MLDVDEKNRCTKGPRVCAGRGNAPPTTVKLNDGRGFVRQVDDMPGFSGGPMERPDAKFRRNIALASGSYQNGA
jgi:hypothetical protein